MLKVCKFGGSSLASGESFEKVKKIIDADKSRMVVVVSAPGKRFKDDIKVTDLLYICHAHIKYSVPFTDIFEQIKERYRLIHKSCGLTQDIEYEFDKIASSLNKKTSVDYIVSRGEYLNARLMAEYLGFAFVDSASWLVFNFNGKVDFERSYKNLSKIIEENPRVVIPGFYGATPDGNIKTFSRGGSDITGAIAAAAINADMYENWTDVSGIMTADPRIVDNPRPIENVTFAELRELSYMGADVLHEETVFPVRQKSIPLYIKNTNDMNARGTLIMESFPDDEDKNSHFITGISGKKNFSIITIAKSRMNDEIGYVRRTLEVFERFQVPIEHIPSSIDSFSVVVASSHVENCMHEIISALNDAVNPDSIKIDNEISLIAIVGRKLASNIGIAGKIFTALGENDINIKMIEQGADEINIIIGVSDRNFKKTIKVLYDLSEVEQ
ncbi:MAG: aspartate kinase [Clostridia bacterium]|nr:aspartate kinase [Clostridia bacterium]MBQ7788894.1 aspartate kinase [Clostridia bacterium]